MSFFTKQYEKVHTYKGNIQDKEVDNIIDEIYKAS